jgi:peptidoglycan hydrolase FlgJ
MNKTLTAAMYGSLPLPERASAEQPIAGAADGLDTSTPAYRTKVANAAEKFEGFFIEQILQQMRRSMREIDPDDGENAKRGENDMLAMADSMLADTLSHRRAFGIADAILRQLLPARSPPAALKPPPPPVALPK